MKRANFSRKIVVMLCVGCAMALLTPVSPARAEKSLLQQIKDSGKKIGKDSKKASRQAKKEGKNAGKAVKKESKKAWKGVKDIFK